MDVWLTTPGTIGVNVRGTFELSVARSERVTVVEYERVLLLVPTPPGSPAALAGWSATVANEQLALVSTARKTVRVKAVEPSGGGSAPPVTPPAVGREALVGQFVGATGLTPEYALRCLTSVGGDPHRAMAAFTAARAAGTLPASAFMRR